MAATIACLCGAFLVVIILHDVFEVMLLPRRVRRPLRLVRFFFRLSWRMWSDTGKRFFVSDRRSHFFSLYGPLSMVVLLALWASTLIVGFGLLHWGLNVGSSLRPSLANQLYFSGETFFTLGYGETVPLTYYSKALAVFEAGTGFGFIAVVIGYLPVLYQLFSQRETRVIQLDARAGSPPTAVQLLSRHGGEAGLEALDRLLERWEEWCAEVVESHLSYPMLSYYRSQHDNQSWLAGIAAVMDTCAVLLVGINGARTFQARMTFSAARLAITELGRVFQIAPRPPDHERLTAGEFRALQQALEEAGFQWNDEEAETELSNFRSTYEPFLCGLADYFLLPIPPWMPSGEALDNWQKSPRGRSAKHLIEKAPGKGD